MLIFKKINGQRVLLIFLCLFCLFTSFCTKKDPTSPIDDIKRRIVILYTNDEHGWMEPTATTGGAAGLMGLWRQQENYREDEPYLIISGGDMWTGPAISTWLKGS